MNKHKIAIILILLIIIGLAFSIFRSGYAMSGDYALYIAQAKHILSGTKQTAYNDMVEMLRMSSYKYYSPILYPWGFPLLLTPVVAIFGIDYTVFKIVIILCFIVGLWFMYLNFKNKGKETIALLMIILIGFNIKYLEFANAVLSDIPYFLFLMLSVYAINKHLLHNYTDKKQITNNILLGIVLFFTMQVRTEGVFLLPALFAYQFFEYFKGKATLKLNKYLLFNAAIPYLTIALLSGIFILFFPAGYMKHSEHLNNIDREIVIRNFNFYFENIRRVLFPFPARHKWLNVLFWSIVVTGLIRTVFNGRYKVVAETVYLCIAVAFLMLWPHVSIRYFVSVMPFILYFFIQGILIIPTSQNFKQINIPIFIFVGILIYTGIFATYKVANYNKSYDAFNLNVEGKEAQDMLQFISRQTKPDDIIGCGESRTIYLYTNRLSCNLSGSVENTVQTADWYVVFRNRGNYLQYYPEILEEQIKYFQEKYRNGDFIVYKILK